MTFASIQTEIGERLNLTSATAVARIGRSINECYRRLASTLGIQTIERVNGITATTTIGNSNLVFTAEKLLAVYDASVTPVRLLDEVAEDQLRNDMVVADPPTEYAIKLMGASTVTIELNVVPATQYALKADAMVNLATLSGSQVPAFSEDYHDILIHGGMEIEYTKMEKLDMAKTKRAEYELRLGEYRLYVAVSAYKQILQGATTTTRNSVPLI